MFTEKRNQILSVKQYCYRHRYKEAKYGELILLQNSDIVLELCVLMLKLRDDHRALELWFTSSIVGSRLQAEAPSP